MMYALCTAIPHRLGLNSFELNGESLMLNSLNSRAVSYIHLQREMETFLIRSLPTMFYQKIII